MANYAGANLTRTWTTDQLEDGTAPKPGDTCWVGNKLYKAVIFDDGTEDHDLVAGDVVYYKDVTGYTTSTVTADVSDSTGQEVGAGVVTTTVTQDTVRMWVQIKGPATLEQGIEGSAADGDPLTVVGATNKSLTRAIEADSTGVYKPVCAYAIDASAKTVACDFLI